jgi:hypothetical protein
MVQVVLGLEVPVVARGDRGIPDLPPRFRLGTADADVLAQRNGVGGPGESGAIACEMTHDGEQEVACRIGGGSPYAAVKQSLRGQFRGPLSRPQQTPQTPNC